MSLEIATVEPWLTGTVEGVRCYQRWDRLPHPAPLEELRRWDHRDVSDEAEVERTLAWLLDLGHGVVEAQQTLEAPVNPWRSGPGTEDHLAELGFLEAGKLRRRLNDAWNDTVALFADDREVFLVCWGTSA